MKTARSRGRAAFLCTSEDMHPYNCDGPRKCRHCGLRQSAHHNPRRCWLCWDADPLTESPGKLSSYRRLGRKWRRLRPSEVKP